MSKTTRKHSRRHPSPVHSVDIVSQLECAIQHPQATLIGALVGGLVPWFARTLAHEQLPAAWTAGNYGLAIVMLMVVLGCSLFSALSVYKFGLATFGDVRKAIGFALAIEGVMLVAHGATSVVALTVLILINALGNGSVIALARAATCKRREADARRAATRRSKITPPCSTQASSPKAPFPVVNGPAPTYTTRQTSNPKIHWVPVVNNASDAQIISEHRLLA